MWITADSRSGGMVAITPYNIILHYKMTFFHKESGISEKRVTVQPKRLNCYKKGNEKCVQQKGEK